MTTTNGTAPPKSAISELTDDERLAIVQEQIQVLLFQCYQLQAAVLAIPKGKGKSKEFEENLKLTSSTLAGYRAIEAELIGRLNSTIASATP